MLLGHIGYRSSGACRMTWAVTGCVVQLALLFGCAKHSGSASTVHDAGVVRVVAAGSTAMLPLVTEVANRFMLKHPNVAISVEAGGSAEGIARTLAGSADIGMSDVPPEPQVATQLQDHQVAITGFAAMANRGKFNEAVTSLTLQQLRDIFSGKTTDWAALGGEHQAITVINRKKGSGTRKTFGTIVLGGDNFAEGPSEESSSLVLTLLEQTTGAISYLGLAYQRPTVKSFAVGGVAATNQNVKNGSYPIWSYEHLFTRGPAAGAAKSFIDYMLSAEVQSTMLEKNGFTAMGKGRREALDSGS